MTISVIKLQVEFRLPLKTEYFLESFFFAEKANMSLKQEQKLKYPILCCVTVVNLLTLKKKSFFFIFSAHVSITC